MWKWRESSGIACRWELTWEGMDVRRRTPHVSRLSVTAGFAVVFFSLSLSFSSLVSSVHSEQVKWTGTNWTWGPFRSIQDQDVIKYEYTNIELICNKRNDSGIVACCFAQYFVVGRREDYATKLCLPCYLTGAGPRSCMNRNRKQVNIFHMCAASHYVTHCLVALLAVYTSAMSRDRLWFVITLYHN